MASKQSRRTVSVVPDLFLKMEKRAVKDNQPKSALVEELIRAWCEGTSKPRAVALVPPTTKPQTKPPKPAFIVNVDLTVSATSDADAMTQVRALILKNGLRGMPIGADAESWLPMPTLPKVEAPKESNVRSHKKPIPQRALRGRR